MALDPLKVRARKAVRLALNEIGRRIRDDIRDSVSVPVQRTGSEIIRSDPGEPPRKEFGDLWRSIKYKVKPKAESIEALIVYSNDEKSPLLEFGTTNMEPRPHFGPARARAKGINNLFKDLVAENMNGMADFPAVDSAVME